jgi:hypothetical protein
MKVGKKLIEVALPLEAINAAASREKGIRHGHPSTLHGAARLRPPQLEVTICDFKLRNSSSLS